MTFQKGNQFWKLRKYKKFTEEHRKKISESLKGRKLSPNIVELNRQRLLRNNPMKKIKVNNGSFKEGHIVPKSWIEKIKQKSSLFKKGHKVTKVMRAKISQGRINWMKHNHYPQPNNLELKFIDFVNHYKLPFRFVGDGQIWINRKNPDFIDTLNHRYLIELFGNYWHNVEEVSKYHYHYHKHNFKCLVIWESDILNLKDEEILLKINDCFKNVKMDRY